MPEFNIRSDSIDVEKIMEQVRARIREKRGVDYTEEQIRELATVKLERFLDPKNVRSDLLEHYRKQHDQPAPAAPSASEPRAVSASDTVATPPFEPVTVHPFEPDVVYQSSRAGIGRVLQTIRRALRPILKLLFNPGPILETLRALSVHAANTNRALLVNEERHVLNEERHSSNQERHRLNDERHKARAELDVLTYEVLNNLVVEMTRLAIDMKNHKMRVESVAARLDFDERRARALEEVVQYRESAGTDGSAAAGEAGAPDAEHGAEGAPEKRRRRRRRGRRRAGGEAGAAATDVTANAGGGSGAGAEAGPAAGTDGATPTAGAEGAAAAGEDARAADTGAPAPAASPGDDVNAPASPDTGPSGANPAPEAPAAPQPAAAADATRSPGGERAADSTDS